MDLDANSIEIQLAQKDQNSFNFGQNAPPGYENSNSKLAAPTSSTFFRTIKYAGDTTRRSYRRLMNLGEICICSSSLLVILVILIAIPITMIIIGFIHFNDCRIQRLIPIWLIVSGFLTIIKNVSTFVDRIKNRDENQTGNKILSVFDSFLTIVIVVWFVCGNIWTYSNYSKVQTTNPSEDNYCHSLVYYFSFWIITSIYILIVVACIIFCCTICITIFLPTRK